MRKKSNKLTFKIHSFYKIAEKFRLEATEEEEIQKFDRTELLYKELDFMIRKKELITLALTGRVRGGKSTTALALGKWCYDIIRPLFNKRYPFGDRNIARDQQEFNKLMRDNETNYTMIVVDEDNSMERTGVNATTEEAFAKTISDVHASRYVHTIFCSPKEIANPNADIIISMISTDKKNMINHGKVYYKYFEGGIERIQLIGHVNIYVGDILYKWVTEGIDLHEKIILGKGNEEDKKKLQELRKDDFYIDYYLKKHEKMDLMTNEGIFRPRMLEIAPIHMDIITKLLPLTKVTGIITTPLIKSYVKMGFRKHKIPVSLIGEQESTNEIYGILNTAIGIEKMKRKIASSKDPDERDSLTRSAQMLYASLEEQVQEVKRLIEINKVYNEIN